MSFFFVLWVERSVACCDKTKKEIVGIFEIHSKRGQLENGFWRKLTRKTSNVKLLTGGNGLLLLAPLRLYSALRAGISVLPIYCYQLYPCPNHRPMRVVASLTKNRNVTFDQMSLSLRITPVLKLFRPDFFKTKWTGLINCLIESQKDKEVLVTICQPV